MMDRADEFSAWYRATHPRLRTALVAASGQPDVGLDVADEAMARAWAHWSRLGDWQSRDGWVYRTAFNVLRRRQRREQLARLIARREPAPVAVNGADSASTLIWSVVADLPPRQREAIVLRHVADLSQEGVARAMGVTRGAASATLSAAYANLRHLLREEAKDAEA